MAEGKLDELNLSPEEISKFGKAFQDETFRNLFRQYLNDISDPVNRKIFENEITQLEKERGHDILFVKPQPGYVIKTSSNGNIKTYINFCTNENIAKFSSIQTEQNNVQGVHLSIPHSVSPLQTKYDKTNAKYNIYTVIFHPETLNYAHENAAVKKLINETAFAAVEKIFNVRLDKVNFVVSKKSHKGCLESTVIRQDKSPENHTDTNLHEDKVLTDNADYTEPSFSIKYRDQVDLQNCTNGVFSKMNALIPTHVVVEIKLPLLKSIQNTTLKIESSSIFLQNDEPVKYKVCIPLAYEVKKDCGSAKFHPDTHVLKLELLVERKHSTNDEIRRNNSKLIAEVSDKLNDLKVESDNSCDRTLTTGNAEQISDSFLHPDLKYKLAEYFCNYYHNKLAYVLKVKNVCYDSFKYRILGDRSCIMKFSTLGAGHFPMYYSFCVSLVDNQLRNIEPLQYLIEDENIFVYLNLETNKLPLEYYVGTDPDNMQKAYLNEPSAIPLQIKDKEDKHIDVNIQVTEFNSEQIILDIRPQQNPSEISISEHTSRNHDDTEISSRRVQNEFLDKINNSKHTADNEKHSLSESELTSKTSHSTSTRKESNSDVENHSCIVESKSAKKARRKQRACEKKLRNGFNFDSQSKLEDDDTFSTGTQPIDIESAYKYADLSSRSILKKNRSFSESSGDELSQLESSRSFSVDDINFSSDSYSHSGPKKSVTFNDVISKKLYSSDISILEQRKRTKRRTQRKERRASESDNSETECTTSTKARQQNIQFYNETLCLDNSETELTSVSESGETSDDQSDTQENTVKTQHIPCSKKNHKRRGKKSARKNASTAKHSFHGDY